MCTCGASAEHEMKLFPDNEHENHYTFSRCTGHAVLDVIAVVSNPARFDRRYHLFVDFCNKIQNLCHSSPTTCSGAPLAHKHKDGMPHIRLTTVELQQGRRDFATNAKVKLRCDDEMWHKENMVNIGIQHLPDDWEYVAWIDTDIEFQNPNWAAEAIQQLQTYNVVQLFSHAIDLGPNGETLQTHLGFGYLYQCGKEWRGPEYSGPYWHPGYAWAMRRSVFNGLGGLIDFAILGSADFHMAMCFIEKVEVTLNSKLNPMYIELVKIWQERCSRVIRKSLGYVAGTILHRFHGDKQNRQYQSRWNVLVNNGFDPLRDIVRDSYGVYWFSKTKPQLEADIQRYFRNRNEDSVDIAQPYRYIPGPTKN